MEPIVQLNSNAKLSEHFLLGEFTKSGSHPNIYNVPTHEAIANLKHLCQWLEVIRYAAILLDYADESQQEFDELLVERNRFGAIWLILQCVLEGIGTKYCISTRNKIGANN